MKIFTISEHNFINGMKEITTDNVIKDSIIILYLTEGLLFSDNITV